jgi:hypothetical protein
LGKFAKVFNPGFLGWGRGQVAADLGLATHLSRGLAGRLGLGNPGGWRQSRRWRGGGNLGCRPETAQPFHQQQVAFLLEGFLEPVPLAQGEYATGGGDQPGRSKYREQD